jgi:hypothetical protein
VAAAALAMSVATPALAFESASQGVVVDSGIGVSHAGDALMFELGGGSAGIRSYGDGRWLFQWDVLVAARGGWLAAQHPFLFLVGPHALAWTEVGYRFLHSSRWSPYLGARIGGDVLVMPHPGLSLGELRTINDVDGVGGVVAKGLVRVEAGVSMLEGQRSVLLVAFAQEAMGGPQVNAPAVAFTEGGLGLRFDLARSLVASVEGVLGIAPARSNGPLGFTDQTTHAGLDLAFRKMFRNGMWLGAAGVIEENTDRVVYSGTTYSTADSPSLGFTLSFGMPLWRVKR